MTRYRLDQWDFEDCWQRHQISGLDVKGEQ
jgi:hypothetical protein